MKDIVWAASLFLAYCGGAVALCALFWWLLGGTMAPFSAIPTRELSGTASHEAAQ